MKVDATITWASRRRGYTFVEMVVALLSASILSVAMVGSAYISTKGLAQAEQSRGNVDVSGVVAQMLNDIRCAKTIISSSPNSLEFTVADRTGDMVDDTIRYSRSAASVAPLVRTFNGVAENVIANTQSWTVDTLTESISTTGGTSNIPGTVSTFTSNTNKQTHLVDATNRAGQYFYPSFPVGTTQWQPTLFRISAKRANGTATGTIIVEAFAASSNGWPTGSAVASGSLNLNDISKSNLQDYDVVLTPTGWLPATQGVSIIVRRGTANLAVELQSATGTGAADVVLSSNSGGSWTLSNSRKLIHRIDGTYQQTSTGVPVQRLRWVRLSMQSTSAAATLWGGSTELLNRPVLP